GPALAGSCVRRAVHWCCEKQPGAIETFAGEIDTIWIAYRWRAIRVRDRHRRISHVRERNVYRDGSIRARSDCSRRAVCCPAHESRGTVPLSIRVRGARGIRFDMTCRVQLVVRPCPGYPVDRRIRSGGRRGGEVLDRQLCRERLLCRIRAKGNGGDIRLVRIGEPGVWSWVVRIASGVENYVNSATGERDWRNSNRSNLQIYLITYRSERKPSADRCHCANSVEVILHCRICRAIGVGRLIAGNLADRRYQIFTPGGCAAVDEIFDDARSAVIRNL